VEGAGSPRAYFVVPSRNLILEDIAPAQLLSPTVRCTYKQLERRVLRISLQELGIFSNSSPFLLKRFRVLSLINRPDRSKIIGRVGVGSLLALLN
jgi:hypothetical protein